MQLRIPISEFLINWSPANLFQLLVIFLKFQCFFVILFNKIMFSHIDNLLYTYISLSFRSQVFVQLFKQWVKNSGTDKEADQAAM